MRCLSLTRARSMCRLPIFARTLDPPARVRGAIPRSCVFLFHGLRWREHRLNQPASHRTAAYWDSIENGETVHGHKNGFINGTAQRKNLSRLQIHHLANVEWQVGKFQANCKFGTEHALA